MSIDTEVADVAGFSGARLARIDNFFNVEVARGAVPGAVLHVERAGEVVMRRVWGYRNRAAGTPMTTDSIFRIYSMTKPMVSFVTLMLAAEGRLYLDQPIADFVPAFAYVRVLADDGRVSPRRAPTIHDLLRHTAGLVYERNGGPVAELYAGVMDGDPTNEAFADRIARLPLAHQPGTVWEYSHATDVLGRVVEVAAGRSLSGVLRQRLLEPLGMADTGFSVPRDEDHARIAEPFPDDRFSENGPPMFNPRKPRAFEAGGMGLVSTLDDYARFCRLLLEEGTLDGRTYLSREMLRFMASDHVGPETGITRLPGSILDPGFGFGLGVSVRLGRGAVPAPGSKGEFGWSGIGGTYFWIDPRDETFGILLTQSPRQRSRHRMILRTMLADADVGARALKAERKRAKQEA
ncbi:Beta-lactamase [Beijerinckiaceae bacterium RH AL1]|nr:serine hydrolase [Beijerinckiaceae bacterium]VVB44492.1 Beta-lactamase [Beijerinckiaceae bacterium RH CH11]VVB44572.1 Beta-lactamase [Beijerinckiaceae bacterium RH AL8]VVC54381.1 Beta-lactamase [Beijerinckiaceae bacterium RH AL1]